MAPSSAASTTYNIRRPVCNKFGSALWIRCFVGSFRNVCVKFDIFVCSSCKSALQANALRLVTAVCMTHESRYCITHVRACMRSLTLRCCPPRQPLGWWANVNRPSLSASRKSACPRLPQKTSGGSGAATQAHAHARTHTRTNARAPHCARACHCAHVHARTRNKPCARARSHAHATRTHARRHAQSKHARLAATCKRGWDGPRHCKRERIPTFQGRSHWVTERTGCEALWSTGGPQHSFAHPVHSLVMRGSPSAHRGESTGCSSAYGTVHECRNTLLTPCLAREWLC